MASTLRTVDDVAFGRLLRAIRIRRGWRQADVAARAGVSTSQVWRAETGRCEELRYADLRAIAGALEVRVRVAATWRGGDADRVTNEAHVALQGRTVAYLPRDWVVSVEVTFSVRGERGAIDILAWHPESRNLLVIEVKAELVDPAALVAQVDRYRRVAPGIARERGWGEPIAVAAWVVVADSSMNRRRVARAGSILRAAFPGSGVATRRWLAAPSGALAALSFLPYSLPGRGGRPMAAIRRVSPRRPA